MFRSSLSLRGIAFIAALMLSGGPALAEDVNSANYMMPGCRALLDTPGNGSMAALCAGIISGLAYRDIDSCPPTGVTGRQMERVVVQYIDAHPARMHEDFRELALEAMKAAWPCKR